MKPSLSLAAALLLSAVLVAPGIAVAAGEGSPSPPPPPSQDKSTKGTHTKKPKTDKSSSAEDFLRGYHAAYSRDLRQRRLCRRHRRAARAGL